MSVSVSRSSDNRGREICHPVPRDVDTARNPYILEAPHVVQQPLQPGCPGRMADQAHMQPDGHHLWVALPLLIKKVETITAVVEEIVCCGEGAATELRVVGGQAVRDHEVGFA